MPPTLSPLRKLAAPSPNVLSFLRAQVNNAFEASAPAPAQRAFSRARGGGGGGQIGKSLKGEIIPCGTRPAREGTRCYTWTRTLEPRTQRPPLDIHNGILSTPTPPLPCLFASSLYRGRSFSTTTQKEVWSVFGARKPPVPPKPHIMGSPLSSVMDDTGGLSALGRHTRSANELKMRCTELDENGQVTMVSGEFKKSELTAKYGLLPRDLRKIDSSYLPHILVRPSAILINLLHLRVLIKHNRVLVFDAYGTTDSKSQSVFMYDLDLKLRQKESLAAGTLAYEFRALEAVLISVTLGLEKEFEGLSEPVVKVLLELEETIDRDKLRYLLIYSKKLGTFEQKARLVRDSLTELLEADDDLSAMYLSEKAVGKIREDDDHTEVEMLLESYHKVADEIVQAAENLVSSIRNTEEIVKAILDSNRNSLMLLELKFSVITLAITAGTFIAALYGMNLKTSIEESEWGFWGVTAVCSALGVFSLMWGLRTLGRVQRVSMWGHSTPGPRKGWGLGVWTRGHKMGREVEDSRDVAFGGAFGGAPRLRPGESVGDLIQRERMVARRLAKAEAAAADDFGK